MIRRHVISFRHAFEGLAHTIQTQPNMVVHFIISLIVICLGIIFRLSYFEWAVVSIVIGIGLTIELVNTSIESVVDLVTEEWRRSAKIAKDTAAAAMLVYAIFATVFAVLLFSSKL